ncbi:MAG: AraC family transcriptional regulator, partial [Bacteroidales bacterium]|nr:AraC family transcriptional regulator [Bacteroidales bacterium]
MTAEKNPFSSEEDIVLIESIRKDSYLGRVVSFEDRTGIILCQEGEAVFSLDLKRYRCKAPFIVVLREGVALTLENASEDFRARAILAGRAFLSSLFTEGSEDIGLSLSVRQSPVASIPENAFSTIDLFWKMIKDSERMLEPILKQKTLRHLFLTMYYGYGSRFMIGPAARLEGRRQEIFEEFISWVEKEHREHRNVAYYAQKAFLSQRYFSTVISQISGKSAKEWIEEAVVLDAKKLLGAGKLSIQQISQILLFPDQSSFGRFFKKSVGVSP